MSTICNRRFTAAFLASAAAAFVLAPVHAQVQAPVPLQVAAQNGDPPARVGRLADVTGTVWSYDPDTNDWIRAERNRPVTTGDRLAADAGARAEIRLGSTTVRLDGGAELLVRRLDDAQVALELTSGSVTARLRDSDSARQFTLTTADGRFTTPVVGSYRFDLTSTSSQVSVLSGRATYEGANSALTVTAGQRGEFWLDERQVAQYVLGVPTRDAFAVWSDDRDRRDDASVSARYVSPEMTGVEDLDSHGTWQQSPDDGALWLPTAVAVDWAPYSSGHWAWVSPWGWTWVDDAPWGFAPFHYGRWMRWHDRWAWAPGSYVARPCYAPALVGWIGGGPVGGQYGGRIGDRGSDRGRPPQIGWFPLAPREVYVPHYRVSPGYVRDVNVSHVRDIPNLAGIVRDPDDAVRRYDYRNRRFAPSVTMVPASVLRDRTPVAPAAEAWRRAQPGRDGGARAEATLPTLAAPPLAGGSGRQGRDNGAPGRRDGPPPPSPIAGIAGVAGVAGIAGGARQRPIDAARGNVGLPGNLALPPRRSPMDPVTRAMPPVVQSRPADPLSRPTNGDQVALPPGVVGERRQSQPFPTDGRGRDQRVGDGVRPQSVQPQLPQQPMVQQPQLQQPRQLQPQQPQPPIERQPGEARPAPVVPAQVFSRPATPVTAQPSVIAPPPAENGMPARRFVQPDARQRNDAERPQAPVIRGNGEAFGGRPSRGDGGEDQRFRPQPPVGTAPEQRPQFNGLPSAAQPPARPAVIVTPPQMPTPVRPAMPVAPVIPAQIGAPAQPAPPQRFSPGDDRGRQENQRQDNQRQR